MQTYENAPKLMWGDRDTPLRAKAQILHKEPVILTMPKSFDDSVNPQDYDCELDKTSGRLVNCNAGPLLNKLATQNGLPELNSIADACKESSSQVDIDHDRKQIIFHD